MKKNITFNIDTNYLSYFFSVVGVSQIIEIFDKEKIEIQFVGGCIRDALMEKKNFDIDFSINCDPITTSKVLSQNNIAILEYGKIYGTITAVIQKNKFEITSLREDLNQSGRYTDIIYTNDWSKDARRRDFTFNAMYMSPFGIITDYFFGKNDIQLQTVRFIGNIEERLQEDYLRILRYFRFLGIFQNVNIIKNYEKILQKNIFQLKNNVTHERTRDEILKMLKNTFNKNSFMSFVNPNEANDLIKTIKQWWIEDKYQLGLDRCMNRVEKIILGI